MGEVLSNIHPLESGEGKKVINSALSLLLLAVLCLCGSRLEWMSGVEAATSSSLTLGEPTISPVKVPLNPLQILIRP